MKQLKVYDHSLMPIWQQDFKFMQSGLLESLASLCTSFGLGRENFIITGCTITDNGSRVSMQSGWAYYQGEILPVHALPVTDHNVGSVKIKLSRIEAYDPSGVKTMTVGDFSAQQDTYRNDYLQPSLVDNLSGDSYDLAISQGFWDLARRLIEVSRIKDSGQIQTLTDNVFYRRIGGAVQISGSLFNDALSGFNGEAVSGLPRPARDMRFMCNPHVEGSYIVLTTEGRLLVYSKSNRIYLDHISYLTYPSYNVIASDGHYSTTSNVGGGQQWDM